MRRRVILILVGLFLSPLPRPSYAGERRLKGSVPLMQAGVITSPGVPLVVAKVNGQNALTVLDTGSGTFLSEAFARSIGWSASPSFKDTGSNDFLVVGVTTAEFRLGGLRFEVNCKVVAGAAIEKALRAPVDAILGREVLGHTAFSIDWRGKTITLWSGAPLSSQELRRAGFNTGDSAPMGVTDDGFTVPVLLNGIKRSFRLDTGCDFTSVRPSADLHVKLLGRHASGSTLYGTSVGEFAEADSIQIGTHRIGRPLLNLQRWFDYDGLLGVDILAELGALVDAPGHRIWFPLKSPRGIQQPVPGDDRVRVSQRLDGVWSVPLCRFEGQYVPAVVVISPGGQLYHFGLASTIRISLIDKDLTATFGGKRVGSSVSGSLGIGTGAPVDVLLTPVQASWRTGKYTFMDGVLGLDALRGLRAVLNLTQGELLLSDGSPGASFPVHAGYQSLPLLPGKGGPEVAWSTRGVRLVSCLNTTSKNNTLPAAPCSAAPLTSRRAAPQEAVVVVQMHLGNRLVPPMEFAVEAGSPSELGLLFLRTTGALVDFGHLTLLLPPQSGTPPILSAAAH